MDEKQSESIPQRAEWQDALPDCACTEEAIEKDSRFESSNFMLGKYHPGAASGYRSEEPTEFISSDGTKMYPGQQCTYDEKGDYITHGPAAGTPDKVSPNYSIRGHYREDTVPWRNMGYEEYNKIWQPNNDNGCKENPPREPVEKTKDAVSEQPAIETQSGDEALESFINEESSADSELESILSEPVPVENDVESLPETQSIEPEMSGQSEM
ncbi:MAG: hypothetical protein AAFY33_19070 [Cyanobacteria bacterium J06643_4]